MRPRRLLVGLLLCAAIAPLARARVLDPASHHLRSKAPDAEREWAEFPAVAKASELVLAFEAQRNAAAQTLRLRHRDLKQQWTIHLNGKPLAKLPQDEALQVTCWPVPAGALRDGRNELKVACGPGPADDVMLGPVELLDEPPAQALAQATLDVTVTDAATGAPLPCRITLADAGGALVSHGLANSPGIAARPGVVYTVAGKARIPLMAGRYAVFAGRGFEYSVARAEVEVAAGSVAPVKLAIRREVDTAGLIACDPHLHTLLWSRHGDASPAERGATLAGEGVELAVSAEHNLQADYAPAVREAGADRFVTTVVGNEVTTSSLGHFNVFPFDPAAKLVRTRGRDWKTLEEDIREAAAADCVICLNHGRDVYAGFRPLGPKRHLSITGESLDGQDLFANAMEVLNSGATMSEPRLLIEDFLGLLSAGKRLTPLGASDSHDVCRYVAGQGRTYIAADDRDPGRIDVPAAVKAIRAGRVAVSYGLLARLTISGRFTHGDLAPIAGDAIDVEVEVHGPSWTKAETVELYANGIKVQEVKVPPAEGSRPGLKWKGSFRLKRPAHDVHLVAVAWGPGTTAPFWAHAKPYQRTSEAYVPYSLAVTGPVYIDADANSAFDAPIVTARKLLAASGDDRAKLAAALAAADDDAVTLQAAALLRQRSPDGIDATLADLDRAAAAAAAASPKIRAALSRYRAALAASTP